MDPAGRLPSGGESDRAAKFYEQALLLVDCCKIPEAIKLLEKAIQLNPQSEIYKETLAFFQMNAECYSCHLQKDKQGLSYASVTQAKSGIDNEKEKSSSAEWYATKTEVKENPGVKTPWSPAVSSSYYSDAYEQATIENPWASFVNSSYKSKKPDSSSVDGLSEIDLPPVNDNSTGSPNRQEEVDSSFCSTVKTPISLQEAMHDNCSFNSDHEPDNHVDVSADHFGYKNGEYPEGIYTYSNDQDENLEARFIDELCMARESAIDDWAKYYDLLRSGLREEVPSTTSDILHHNIPTTHQYSDSSDELDETVKVKQRDHLKMDQSSSDKPFSKDNGKVCSKCGHVTEGRNLPPSPTKTRIHFVNGACVSSPNNPHCTCNKQKKGSSEGQSPKSSLSSSQQEFYRNLQNYFGNGKVKTMKTDMETEKKSLKKSSAELFPDPTIRYNSYDSNVSSNTTKELPKVKSEQTVTENRECSTNSGMQNGNQIPKEHFSHKAKSEISSDGSSVDPKSVKSSLNEEGMKKGKKPFGKERFQHASFKPKSRVDEKVRNKLKASVKTEHVKTSKDGTSQRGDSHRQAKAKVGVKSRGSHRVKAEDTTKTMPTSDVKEKPSHKQRVKGTTEVDFTKLFYSLYCTGVSVLSKCGQAFKSVIYYVLVLLVLLFGFFIYCIWFAVCWCCKKVLHYVAIDRWLVQVKNKVSAVYEWIKKRRERRKVSAEGQTYDLPKNGDAAVLHMLQNKDNDPYSVLGVPRDATDDDIRKQYRKLAVLIHPDKNTHPQADEAFKTLANAFDILSDPEKRSDFDAEEAWKRRAEEREGRCGPASPEQFFADLGRKMQEMQNYLHCNACDGKHRRYSTDRFILTARFCGRCNTRHAAKEGDLWAESSFLGYKLHFYACMEGEVFDVTEWAACQGIGSYRVEPNPHTVHLKLKTRQPHPSGFSSRSEERDFENFMRAFFGQFPPDRERYQGTSKPQKRRRKKKH